MRPEDLKPIESGSLELHPMRGDLIPSEMVADAIESAMNAAVEVEVCERIAPYSKDILSLKSSHLAWLNKISELRGLNG